MSAFVESGEAQTLLDIVREQPELLTVAKIYGLLSEHGDCDTLHSLIEGQEAGVQAFLLSSSLLVSDLARNQCGSFVVDLIRKFKPETQEAVALSLAETSYGLTDLVRFGQDKEVAELIQSLPRETQKTLLLSHGVLLTLAYYGQAEAVVSMIEKMPSKDRKDILIGNDFEAPPILRLCAYGQAEALARIIGGMDTEDQADLLTSPRAIFGLAKYGQVEFVADLVRSMPEAVQEKILSSDGAVLGFAESGQGPVIVELFNDQSLAKQKNIFFRTLMGLHPPGKKARPAEISDEALLSQRKKRRDEFLYTSATICSSLNSWMNPFINRYDIQSEAVQQTLSDMALSIRHRQVLSKKLAFDLRSPNGFQVDLIVGIVKALPSDALRQVLLVPETVYNLSACGHAKLAADAISDQPLAAQQQILMSDKAVLGLVHFGRQTQTVVRLLRAWPQEIQREFLDGTFGSSVSVSELLSCYGQAGAVERIRASWEASPHMPDPAEPSRPVLAAPGM
ncbi:MAG: hypothetical protein PHE27_00495 [Alphaproteobacteria bacterium]|nr:hypothetical protein [Alphaproteobacteria bacterium]